LRGQRLLHLAFTVSVPRSEILGCVPASGPRSPSPPVGLCADCAHRREVRNTRGSVFTLCELSRTDPAYPRYPRLPVMSCSGHTPGGTVAERGRGSEPDAQAGG
jgi:hypothetical protein